jgi:hypothetical protein
MFAAWLDPNHNNPAKHGELRWYAMEDGKEIERPNGDAYEHEGEQVIPKSRTFIPAKLDDNKYLKDTGYRATLQALPEPLRSQMLYGDFSAGREDDQWQVIPSDWVKQAQKRWEPRELDYEKVTAVGVDPSRGGKDETCIAAREGWYFHQIERHRGYEMPDGNSVAARVLEMVGHGMCPIHVDVIGIGASVVDSLSMYIPHRVVPNNAAEKASGSDWSGTLKFANKRAEMWWRMRDLLNPANGQKISLPPDSKLAAELCSPTYKLGPSGILIEKKEDLIRRLGRSTDSADSVIMSCERGHPVHIEGVYRNNLRVKGSLAQ